MQSFTDLLDLKPDPDKKRKPEYQMREVSAPCCPVCDEVLMGKNTESSPWNCSCGVWENTEEDPFNYKVVKYNK